MGRRSGLRGRASLASPLPTGGDPQWSTLSSLPSLEGAWVAGSQGPCVHPMLQTAGSAPSLCQLSPHKYFHSKGLQHYTSVQSLSRVRLFVTPWTAAHQASLSIINSQSLLKSMCIESVMPSNHLILCHRLLLLPSVFPSIWVFPNESTLRMRWPKYWSFSFSISPSNEHPGLISFRMDWLDLLAI